MGATVAAVAAALGPLTTLGLGGAAGELVTAKSEAELVAALRAYPDAVLLAGGSNVVIADSGVAGPVVLVRNGGVSRDGARLVAGAGESWDALVAAAVEFGLAGMECLSGIPGSVGATPIQNVGAYGQEVAETIAWVRVLDRARDAVVTIDGADCGFAYRSSRFKHDPRFAVLAVAFDLEDAGGLSGPVRYAELAAALGVAVGERAPLAEVRAAVLELRRGKGMVVDPSDPDSRSAGSFFTNPILEASAFDALRARADSADGPPPAWPQPDGRVKTSAAWLIAHSGWARGDGDGPVGISAKHTLALVNRGGASTAQLVAFAGAVAERVDARWGVRLEPEPVFVGHAWPG